MSCIGPGLEPPNHDDESGGMLGGTGAGAGGSAGLGNPTAGVGGASGSGGMAAGEGGGSGTEPIGGTGAATTGGTGGFAGMASGGAGGAGGAAGDAASDPDAGAGDGGVPILECEESRETLELDVIALSMNVPRCLARSTGQGELVALAITPVESPLAGGAETIWPLRTDACEDPLGFSATADLFPGLAIELCSELCTPILQDGADAYQIELIYGCEPPE